MKAVSVATLLIIVPLDMENSNNIVLVDDRIAKVAELLQVVLNSDVCPITGMCTVGISTQRWRGLYVPMVPTLYI